MDQRTDHRPPDDLAKVSDTHLHSWMDVLDRRLIHQCDEPHPTDVADYMRVWNEIKRRKGEPPTDAPLAEPLTTSKPRLGPNAQSSRRLAGICDRARGSGGDARMHHDRLPAGQQG